MPIQFPPTVIETGAIKQPREVMHAVRAIDGSRYVVAMSGGAPAHRATLVAGMFEQMRANRDWSFMPIDDVYQRYVGRAAPADRSLAGVLGMLFDIGGGTYRMTTPDGRTRDLKPVSIRQGYTDRSAFVDALAKSPAKLMTTLQALSLTNPETTVFAIDADASPGRGVRRGAGDPLWDLFNMLVHNPTDVRFIVTGKEANKLLPPSAPTGRIQAIELR
ncbi:MAG: hypothetical protein ACAI38_24180 [Myxococcota bacterium]|nr:hypothetical protein [Myxococcota bacterium]